jgi:putative nucleotidyltransferase with HDIG domain
MNNPEFFTENQTGGRSPHEGRPEDESAEIIKNHVVDGLKIAKQYNLPEKIQDFIASHHGESKAMYFYVNFVKNHPEAAVDEAKFTYPGPRPSSREMCILSMCDAVEAASRSMKDYNDQSINDLVENIISTQVRDGMFDLAPITFDQIKIIKAVLKSKLKTIYHTRISYPELKK